MPRPTVPRRSRSPSSDLTLGDIVIVTAGELIPGDGDIVHGIATVDESAITGESAPVVRESGGDRSAVTGGTRVLSDRIVVRITSKPGETFVDRMIALVEGASRQKTPNEIALNILLASLSIVFVIVVLTLNPIASYAAAPVSIPVLVALLVCLIPTTIGALLSAIGIAGMDRLVQRNVLAMSGRAVEAAGDVTTLLLDKTGTITYGNRRASEFVTMPGASDEELARAAALSSLADPTPEGVSVVELAAVRSIHVTAPDGAISVPFTAQTRMSGVDLADGTQVRKGAGSAVLAWLEAIRIPRGARDPRTPDQRDRRHRRNRAAPRWWSRCSAADGAGRVLGVIHLKDIVKDGLRERFAELRAMGIRTVMITGDNPLTARAIAKEAGVDDYLAEATPEDKLALIRREQEGGNLVAMTGDGTNDAPALAQADVGVAMNTGTSAAKEAGNMVDLDSDPTKLIDIVRIGKQLLITRGALTTFSLANDIAKYFAIIPAMFMGDLPRARGAEHHAAQLAGIRRHERDHLQRDRHRRPHPAGAARREVPPGERIADPQPQPARLRPRRRDRPLHRHQAHRPRREPHPGLLSPTGDAHVHHHPHHRPHRRAWRCAPCSSSPSCSGSATRRWSPASGSWRCPGRRTARS